MKSAPILIVTACTSRISLPDSEPADPPVKPVLPQRESRIFFQQVPQPVLQSVPLRIPLAQKAITSVLSGNRDVTTKVRNSRRLGGGFHRLQSRQQIQHDVTGDILPVLAVRVHAKTVVHHTPDY